MTHMSGRTEPGDEPDLAAMEKELVLRELMEIAEAMPPIEEVERRRARMTAAQREMFDEALAKLADDLDDLRDL